MSSSNTVYSVPGAYTPPLAKLTVPQLKALCKERKITGYSKLGRQALVQKLVESGLCFADTSHSGTPSTTPAERAPPDATTHTSTAASQPVSATASRPPSIAPTSTPSLVVPEDASTPPIDVRGLPSAPSPITVSTVQAEYGTPSPCVSQAPTLARNAPTSRPSVTAKKRIRPSIETMPPPPAKKQRILSSSSTANVQPSPAPVTAMPCKPPASVVMTPTRTRVPVTPTRAVPVSAPAPATVSASAKRFKPLVVNKAKISALSTPAQSSASASVSSTAPVHLLALTEKPLSSLQDFEATVPALRPITLPPSLAHRKRVQSWAVILSGLSDKERAACALVSRAFRYAVYLSASCILTQQYQGRRLQDDVLRKHSQAMTNMWPYLRARQAEVGQRRRVYETSFLARILQRCGLANPVSSRLWASPDSSKQLLVVIRFVLTRAWFELSVRTSPGGATDANSWLHGTIVDAQEVVAGEVWLVSVEYASPRPREVFYVLEATCEVVGRPSPPRFRPEDAIPSSPGSVSLPVRADWSAYIEQRREAPPGSTSPPPLLAHLKWAGVEDYYQGISKLWLKKVVGEGRLGDRKRMVAERYVLACVVGNGISGQWMTTNEMAQEFAGLPERVAAPPGRQKSSALNLYLPEHHHVESVHFTSAGGKDLHVALAVVQTPHREYYILRDNGMQVGCEEEGVAAVWREVLRCDAKGLPTST
ncbi:hypothetical protein L227DRAFT_522666 [Lentinus tigrinus ALCF2SS1-6]|uniref:Rho termination factor N-terminal domain-containing protein n=1 Tax=Lentinus tigrinus ALCF2SS1-6 TaxID=1328759 RepID=A0A5C2SI46_9APHY|nr:hypothetical protein L227DRAFT_522666 [Lentinus tigrinus ALCF2SS1-6]